MGSPLFPLASGPSFSLFFPGPGLAQDCTTHDADAGAVAVAALAQLHRNTSEIFFDQQSIPHLHASHHTTTNTTNMAKTAVHFGAGNIGRGFVACFLHNSGYDVIFADVADALIDKINATPSYRVIEVGTEGTSENKITNYRAINSKTHEADLIEEISKADIVTCSVGPNILKFIAPVIAKGIDRRAEGETPLHVIACENAIGATDTLASFIKDPKNTPENRLEDHHLRARYANSAIDRIVPAQDPNAGLDVTLEKFFEWVVDKTPFEDIGIPPIEGINWVDNLAPFIERKLFTVNTGHATAAYHGYNRRKRTVYDALQDKAIMEEVRGALMETKNLIVSKHGITEEAQSAYVDKIIKRIGNPHLEDAVERVGRAPLRKLSRKERFIGPAAELAENDQSIKYLLDAIEMTFRFQNVEDDDESKELAKIMAADKPEEIVTKVCGVQSSEKIYQPLVSIVKRVQADSRED
ncbi:Mannitol-1-phosphate 5-dehydrogenase [Paramyrothecium foliicola]|nr:Mannitol-1-phosphate 5-dehydrogenase [Paramyrothecium foliicola]